MSRLRDRITNHWIVILVSFCLPIVSIACAVEYKVLVEPKIFEIERLDKEIEEKQDTKIIEKPIISINQIVPCKDSIGISFFIDSNDNSFYRIFKETGGKFYYSENFFYFMFNSKYSIKLYKISKQLNKSIESDVFEEHCLVTQDLVDDNATLVHSEVIDVKEFMEKSNF